MSQKLLGAVWLIFCSFGAFAQSRDTVIRGKVDTVINAPKKATEAAPEKFYPKIRKEKIYNPDTTHIPSLAVKRSLIIPGWGQLYNKKGAWWKIPAIYGGLGALGYNIVTSQQGYKKFLAFYRIKNLGRTPIATDAEYASYIKYKDEYTIYSGQSLQYFQEGVSTYQRNFQISILGVIAVWGIQAVEAYVEAKFISSFSVDTDLAMKIGPSFINQPVYAMAGSANAYIPGLKITFTLK
ncbi:DUF5683 domain-containing protein [Mucilaginibacter glaciei]|uniref:DUF5683 domain-containing protein n=1 Tax=Mucilaginibacter glaciei TaxID=2772109 RepID=A0A926NK64_9SPHI|nr:DUF5683 domain-containing protein [Mucilaginibacter glaciei]MBD1392736.1 hypothetical protein [Mucilaginibacter glaciei]